MPPDPKTRFPHGIFSLWLILVLAVSVVAEIGAATGIVPKEVLEGLSKGPAGWWQAPPWLHWAEALLLVLLIAGLSALLFASDGERRTLWIGGLAAALLASHFSPLHAGLPYAPLAGTLLAVALTAGLLRGASLTSACGTFRAAIRNARLAGAILWSLAAAVVFYALVNQFGEAARVVSRDTDFGTFYDAALAVTTGNDPYAATGGKYFYPPAFAFYFAVLTYLPKAGASLLWFTIKLALVLWTLTAVYGLVRDPGASPRARRWLAASVVLVAARFLLADLRFGNVNAFVLWLSVAAIVLDFERRSVLAGLAVAAAASVKIVPAVFLVYFLARGRYRAVLWTAVWIAALNLAPLVSGPGGFVSTWASYVDTGVHGKLTSRLAQPDNQSLWGALNRAIDMPLAPVTLVWAAFAVALAAVAASAARRVRRDGVFRQAGAASLFFLLGLLVSPGSWVVHYVAVLLPMSYLLAAGVMGPSHRRAYAIVFIAANLVFTVSGWWRSTVRLSIEQSWFVAANVLLFLTLAALVLADRRAGKTRGVPRESGAGREDPEKPE